MFKTKVNSLAQKEVEDIFSKTMEKNHFKGASTLRLARTFLSKNKVMETWKGQQTTKEKDTKLMLSRHD